MGRGERDLIAVDPGEHAGIAVFEDGVLTKVELVVGAVYREWEWLGRKGMHVVCEVPQKYKGSPVDMDNLITLAFTAGYITGQLKPSSITKVLPREWKGQRRKLVDNSYTLRLLNDQERQILDRSGIPSGLKHNVMDAIGIGLWRLGRRNG